MYFSMSSASFLSIFCRSELLRSSSFARSSAPTGSRINRSSTPLIGSAILPRLLSLGATLEAMSVGVISPVFRSQTENSLERPILLVLRSCLRP
jgi:hypothetical protein